MTFLEWAGLSAPAVSAVALASWRLSSRLTKIEDDVKAVQKAVDRHASGPEKLATLETKLDALTETVERHEGAVEQVHDLRARVKLLTARGSRQ